MLVNSWVCPYPKKSNVWVVVIWMTFSVSMEITVRLTSTFLRQKGKENCGVFSIFWKCVASVLQIQLCVNFRAKFISFNGNRNKTRTSVVSSRKLNWQGICKKNLFPPQKKNNSWYECKLFFKRKAVGQFWNSSEIQLCSAFINACFYASVCCSMFIACSVSCLFKNFSVLIPFSLFILSRREPKTLSALHSLLSNRWF